MAIGTPSSGVKPIVVSTERPSSTAVTEQPPPRWQTTSRGHGARARAAPLRPRARGSRSGGPPTPRASAPAARRSTPRPGSWRGRPCRRPRRAARPGSARVASSIPRSAGALCSGASASSSAIALAHLASIDDRLAEARAAVDDAVPDRVDAAEPSHRATRPRRRSRRRRRACSFEARRPGVDDEDGFSSGQAQSRISGSSSPCSRVYARAREPRVDHLLAQVRGAVGRARARGRSRPSRGGSGRGRSA